MANVQHWLHGTTDLLPFQKLVLIYDAMCSLSRLSRTHFNDCPL